MAGYSSSALSPEKEADTTGGAEKVDLRGQCCAKGLIFRNDEPLLISIVVLCTKHLHRNPGVFESSQHWGLGQNFTTDFNGNRVRPKLNTFENMLQVKVSNVGWR